MTATVFLSMDELRADELDLSLSERVALANDWVGARREEDGSLIISLDVHPIEAISVLPGPNFRTGIMDGLKKRFRSRSGDSDDARWVPRRSLD